MADRPSDACGLEPQELLRYSRHLLLPEVGVDGQLRLRAASVLIVGAGGLGSPIALYLAAAGVGRIGLVDFDAVDLSNLQRQLLYGTADVGRPKLERARERIHEVNPHVDVGLHPVRLVAQNAAEIVGGYDVVIDGTDNFPTRYLVNDACVLLGKPNVYGSIFRFEGQLSLFWAPHGPCYRCLFPEPPPPGAIPSCAEGGVLGVLPGIIGTLQATEAIKWILGRGDSLVGRLLLFDALETRFRELGLRRDPGCPVCGDRPTILELTDSASHCGVALPESIGDELPSIDARTLKRRLDDGGALQLIDVRTQEEWTLCRLPGARLVPLHELERRLPELDRNCDTVAYCHHGNRSAQATRLLRECGFRSALNLSGGIDAWSREIDPTLPRY